jgi:hypothetical protein
MPNTQIFISYRHLFTTLYSNACTSAFHVIWVIELNIPSIFLYYGRLSSEAIYLSIYLLNSFAPFFKCCFSVHVDNYTIIVPTKCTSFYY